MKYVIAVYRSRNITMQAYNFLHKNNVTAALVSTPSSLNIGCGLSVRFPHGTLENFGKILADVETFVGFFLVTHTLCGTTVTQLQ